MSTLEKLADPRGAAAGRNLAEAGVRDATLSVADMLLWFDSDDATPGSFDLVTRWPRDRDLVTS